MDCTHYFPFIQGNSLPFPSEKAAEEMISTFSGILPSPKTTPDARVKGNRLK
jgi:hypothetical protein